MIGIICAMEEELEPIISSIKSVKKSVFSNITFYSGEYLGCKTVLCVSGVGKVNSSMTTQCLIDHFPIDYIINSGIAGGISLNVGLGDVIISEKAIQYDVDVTSLGYKKGFIPDTNIDFFISKNIIGEALLDSLFLENTKLHYGVVGTGDRFISDFSFKSELYNEFEIDCCDMEGASIAQVSTLNNIPFLIVRSISDNANNNSPIDYPTFKKYAIKNQSELLKQIIEKNFSY